MEEGALISRSAQQGLVPVKQTVRISVIVPVWNGQDVIDRCLFALTNQSLPKDQYEIIVIDNGSSDDTLKKVGRFDGIVVLEEPEAGSYRARNRGIPKAMGEYIAFTDADCIPDADWLSEGLRFIERNAECSVAAGRIELERGQQLDESPSQIYERIFSFNQRRNARNRSCVTANWLSPSKVIRRNDGFLDSLKSGGDEELCRRIAASGGRVCYAHEMCVRHPTRSGLKQLCEQRMRTLGGKWDRRNVGLLIWFLHVSARAAREAVIVAMYRKLSLASRFLVIDVVIKLLVASYGELLRLDAGGISRRA